MPVEGRPSDSAAFLLVGLTGGVATGKSSVSSRLAARGARVVDADLIAREIVMPGTLAYAEIVTHFGPAVLAADGTLDRGALRAIVFADDAQRAVLNAITHPRIGIELGRRIGDASAGEIVVLDVALLVQPTGRTEGSAALAAAAFGGMDLLVVVHVAEATQLARLARDRGLDDTTGRAIIAAQADAVTRLSEADIVVDNSGTRADLDAAVAHLWEVLSGALDAKRAGTDPATAIPDADRPARLLARLRH